MKERGWGTRSIPALLFRESARTGVLRTVIRAGSLKEKSPANPRRQNRVGLLLFVDREVVLFHLRAHAIERVVHIVGQLEQLVLALVDRSVTQHLAPVEHLVPVFPAVNQN